MQLEIMFESANTGKYSNWSNEIFLIRKVKLTNPTTYLLKDMNGKDILGGFYEMELQKEKHPDFYCDAPNRFAKLRILIFKIISTKHFKSRSFWGANASQF
jgi:hypothetical protein